MAIKVVGDICVDVGHECDCNRLSPEGPFPILRKQGNTTYSLGMAGYVVSLISSLTDSVPIFYYGSWEQNLGHLNIEKLLQDNDSKKCLKVNRLPGKSTIVKNRYYVDTHMVSRIDEDCYKPLVIKASDLDLGPSDILLNSDYQKGTILDMSLEEANKVAYSLYDPHMETQIDSLLGYTIITPNDREYMQLTRQAQERGFESILGFIHEKSPLPRNRYIVHTAGDKGLYLEYINIRKQEIFKKHYKPLGVCKRKVVDIVGAGDCIISGLAIALHSGKLVEEAITYAMLLAEIAIMHKGTYVVNHEDIKNFVR